MIDTYDFINNSTSVDNKPGERSDQFHHGTQVLSTIAAMDEGNVSILK